MFLAPIRRAPDAAAVPPAHGAAHGIEAALAVIVALVLSASWASTQWPELSRLILPDADDMVRLAQVRDWIAGQAMNDWTQYRMAPPNGAPMHWSRINDLLPAGLILLLRPLIGQPLAELAAVIIAPLMLFCATLWLSAQIARRLWDAPAAGPIAIILSGLAYPATTLFIPGRIDHHALQVVVIQIAVLAMMARASARSGALAGLALALSMMIGLETVPQNAVLILFLFALWVIRGTREQARLAGFAGALGGLTLLFLATMRPTLWTAAFCDAFTPASASALIAGSVALGLLAGATPRLPDWRWRLVLGAVLGMGVVGCVLAAFPGCLTGPYGEVHPFLRANFITHIDEANSIFAQAGVPRALSLIGVCLVASFVTLAALIARPGGWTRIAPVGGVVIVSTLIMLAQVRGAYIGAPLAPPLLAGAVLWARAQNRHRLPALLAAWIACAGIAWLEAPRAVHRLVAGAPLPSANSSPQIACKAGDVWQQVDALPTGVVMAPTNMASYLLGATRHATVGAGYHRNDAANMDMYRFFLGPQHRAVALARRWRVDYVAFCPGDFTEMRLIQRHPGSIAAELHHGRVPSWLVPVPLGATNLRFFRIARLPEPAALP